MLRSRRVLRKSRRTLRKSSRIKQYYKSKRKESNRKYVDGVKNLPDEDTEDTEDQLVYDLTTEKEELFGYAPGHSPKTTSPKPKPKPKPKSKPKPKPKPKPNSLHKIFKSIKKKYNNKK